MSDEEALTIVVQAGKEGQKKLLEMLFQEMNQDDLEEILEDNGFVAAE